MTANERDSRVAVVHRCFSEGGNSLLSAFSWILLIHTCQLVLCSSVSIIPPHSLKQGIMIVFPTYIHNN